jgi:spore maturation protein CgeB
MRILWSFNKQGREAEHWDREIRAASSDAVTFIPFNHGHLVDVTRLMDAWRLDTEYRNHSTALASLQSEVQAALKANDASILCVTNCPPYHPDFLRTLPVYKVLYSTDDPEATYKRTIPYLHAYDHVLFCAPGYSRDMDLEAKMRYAGMRNADWLPLGVFDFEHNPVASESDLFEHTRDIDIVYVGAFWRQKMATLMAVQRAFGRKFVMHGVFLARHNLYINAKYRAGRWVRPVSMEERVALYQRARIGINLHWNEHGLGNQRLYHLPANGVMQICDCPSYVNRVFEAGREVVPYDNDDDLIERIRFYLSNDSERLRIARAGFQRVERDYRIRTVLRRAAALIERGLRAKTGSTAATSVAGRTASS